MTSRAGIRELRQNLSRYIDRVRTGETIEVTDHGQLVARLTPASDTRSEIAALEAHGLVVQAPSLDFASLAPPRSRRADEPVPSEILADERAEQRY